MGHNSWDSCDGFGTLDDTGWLYFSKLCCSVLREQLLVFGRPLVDIS